MTMRTINSDGLLEHFEAFVREDPAVNRWELYRQCRSEPMFYSPSLDAWVVTRYDDVLTVLKDGETFVTLEKGPGSTVYGRTILHMRGDEHRKKRGVAARQLAGAKAVARVDAFLTRACRDLTGALPMSPEVAELKRAYCMWIPLMVIGDLMNVEDPSRFCDWYSTISAGSMSSMGHPERYELAKVAVRELGDYIRPLIEERRVTPGDDIISDYCQATYNDQPIPDDEIIAMVVLLLTAGVETTERGLANLLLLLIEQPDLWHLVRNDRTLVESAAAEALRYMAPIHAVTRKSSREVEFGGQVLPADTRFFALVASANRDESQFPDGERFDPTRFRADAARQYTGAAQILPFGGGAHLCAGAPLVQLEMRHALNALMDRVSDISFRDGVPTPVGFLLHSSTRLDVLLTPAG